MLNLVESDDDNAFLRRRKKSLKRKFRPTRSNTILDANALAIFLCSLGRGAEAHNLVKSYAESIAFVEHRIERWIATCQAILILSDLEESRNRMQESERLARIVLDHDYHVGEKDKSKLFWEQIESYESILKMIEWPDVKHTDQCIILAETIIGFLYFKQLLPYIRRLGEIERRLAKCNIDNCYRLLKERLSEKKEDQGI